MFFLNILTAYTNQIAKKYGTQYLTFAVFGIINYPITLIYEAFIQNDLNGITLRLIASSLCFILLFKNHWPQEYKKFLPLFWYITIIISLPMLTVFMLLKNNLSLGWLINFNIGVMIAILLLDSITFIIIEVIGISLGVLCFLLSDHKLDYNHNIDNLALFLYMFLCIVILGPIFAKNKEIFNHFKQKAKDQLNEELEQKVQERTLELQKALAAKTEFLNNISHEVRTPIQGFTTLSEGLVEHWNSFDEAKKFHLAKNVASNAQRLASLVNNLLDLSKLTANKMILDLHSTDLEPLIEEIIDECTNLYIHQKKIKIQFVKPESKILIRIDKDRISQVLRNLFANAIKFSSDNSVILASVIWLNNECHFTVSDEGVGVPEDELNSIFDSFTQSSRTRSLAGGTGLGLAICQKIIEAHGGRIWATNNPNRGASFHFTLPTINNSIERSELKIKSNANILIIDDEESCLISMEILLINSPYSLVKANSGELALKYLEEYNDIDVIMLDLMMPDILGLDLLKIIKSNPKFSNIPVILQTGSSNEELIEAALSSGAIAYVKKPYSKLEIFNALDTALN